MDKEIQIEILDRVKYIVEHFETLTLIEIATLFVVCGNPIYRYKESILLFVSQGNATNTRRKTDKSPNG
ncbi:hypothetical protein MGH68_13650 [Erysipelothrix sp. D19-032]